MTPELAAQIVHLYCDERQSQREVAERLRISRKAVRRVLIEARVQMRNPGPARRWAFTPEQAAQAVRLYRDNQWSIRDIAAHFQRSYGAVQTTLHEAGVTMRPSGGNHKAREKKPLTSDN